MLIPLTLLAIESSGVIAMRAMKLTAGDVVAIQEARLMMSEKVDAALEATASLIAGASGDQIINRYRQHVAVNAKRLSKRHSNSADRSII
jgi:phosphoserine phosphatase